MRVLDAETEHPLSAGKHINRAIRKNDAGSDVRVLAKALMCTILCDCPWFTFCFKEDLRYSFR